MDSKLDHLHSSLLALEAEKRTLLLALQSHLESSANLPNSPPTGNIETYLPSTHAHTKAIVPLTPATEAQLLEVAQATIKRHIKLLHRYNEVRDVGQGLIGMVAENRKVRVRDVQEEFGVANGD